MSSTRLAAIPPAFGVRTLPAQATEYTFAYIQVPEDVSMSRTLRLFFPTLASVGSVRVSFMARRNVAVGGVGPSDGA